MNVLAIVPCYNEEHSLKDTVENLKSNAATVDFVVVNDGSLDNTYQICVDNGYKVINIPYNLGLANAVQAGMRYAYNNGYDMALQFDGDGQHLPGYILDMVTLMRNTSADIVVGSRYMLKSSISLRSFGGNLLRVAVKIVTGKTMTDPTSGMRLYNRKMIDKFANHMNHGPEPDTLAFLIRRGAILHELPVEMQDRKAGKSYFSGLVAVNYMLRMFVSILLIQWFRAKEKDI